MNKISITKLQQYLCKFHKNRNLHKYEKKLLEDYKNIEGLIKSAKRFQNIQISDKYVSLDTFLKLMIKCYNYGLENKEYLVEVLSLIDKFEYAQLENETDFIKQKFIILLDIRELLR